MAIPWLAALQLVPWSQVIEHAPKVLAKAQALLRRRSAPVDPADRPQTDVGDIDREALDPVQLVRRISELEARVEFQRLQLDQQAQMLGELAEQSASLIAAVEMQRRRNRWLQLGLYGLALALLLVVLTGR
jgi:hypothetical protein